MTGNRPRVASVAFRADASVQIGTGHVMRCLTLADALREHQAESVFLCRPHDGHLLGLIAARGHRAVALSSRHADGTAVDEGTLAHAHWLGTDWATDADDSRIALAETIGQAGVDWLVVDHYALDHRWERAMRPHCRHLLAIDDLADRLHACDLLLDQNLGRNAADYQELRPRESQALIGPRYALLRPEFAAQRAKSLARRKNPKFEHLLVTMGGVDKDNATGAVLAALQDCDLPAELRITVVMGPHAPWLAQVQAQAATMGRPTRVLTGVNDMAELMVEADLAIGASGSTSWERCCLGIPAIQLVLAENQRMIAKALVDAGVALVIDHSSVERELPLIFNEARTLEQLMVRTHEISSITDGLGARRVADILIGSGI